MMGRGLKIPGIATKKPTKPIVIKLTSFLLYSPSEYFFCDAIHSSQCFSRSGKQFLQSSFVNLSRASWGFVLFLLFFPVDFFHSDESFPPLVSFLISE